MAFSFSENAATETSYPFPLIKISSCRQFFRTKLHGLQIKISSWQKVQIYCKTCCASSEVSLLIWRFWVGVKNDANAL